MPYLVAACFAGALGAIEQYNRLKTRLTREDYAWAFWILRIALEAAIGLAALAITKAVKPTFIDGNPLAWIVAGAAGPAAARVRIIDVGPGDDATPLGLAAVYEPFRDWIAKRLDDIGAAAQSRWLTEDLLPSLNRTNVPPKEISDRYGLWLEGSERFSQLQKIEERRYIVDTLASADSHDLKRELLVLRAVKLGAYRVLRDLRKSCGS